MLNINVMDNIFLITFSSIKVAKKIKVMRADKIRNTSKRILEVLIAANFKTLLKYNLGICNLLANLI